MTRSSLIPLVALVALASVRVAAADPVAGRVLTVPTAWLPPQGAAIGTASLDRRGDGSMVVGYGLGGIAVTELGFDTDLRGCDPCVTDGRSQALWLGRAGFKLAARQGAWFSGMPALAFGVRTTFAAHGHTFGGARVTEGFLVASGELGEDSGHRVRFHGGLEVVDAGYGDVTMGKQVRPLAGFEWVPRQYPKTTLLLDGMWLPRFERDRPTLEWIAGFGVRYQALSWGSIELDVRERQALEGSGPESIDGINVLVKVIGVAR